MQNNNPSASAQTNQNETLTLALIYAKACLLDPDAVAVDRVRLRAIAVIDQAIRTASN